MRARLSRTGFSLLELMMVIAVMAIFTAALIPWAESTSHDTMIAAAQNVATDLAYARSLAVSNNSNYVVRFNKDNNRYILEHSGSNAALDTLPDSVFRNADDPPNKHIVKLDELPGIGEPVELVGVFRAADTPESIENIEFGPLGETTETSPSIVLIKLGTKSRLRHALIVVNPITGLATVYPYSENLPSDIPTTVVEQITDML